MNAVLKGLLTLTSLIAGGAETLAQPELRSAARGAEERPAIFAPLPAEPATTAVRRSPRLVSQQMRQHITEAALHGRSSEAADEATRAAAAGTDPEDRVDVIRLERYLVQGRRERQVTLPLPRNAVGEAIKTGRIYRYEAPSFAAMIATLPAKVWRTGVSRVELGFNLQW